MRVTLHWLTLLPGQLSKGEGRDEQTTRIPDREDVMWNITEILQASNLKKYKWRHNIHVWNPELKYKCHYKTNLAVSIVFGQKFHQFLRTMYSRHSICENLAPKNQFGFLHWLWGRDFTRQLWIEIYHFSLTFLGVDLANLLWLTILTSRQYTRKGGFNV